MLLQYFLTFGAQSVEKGAQSALANQCQDISADQMRCSRRLANLVQTQNSDHGSVLILLELSRNQL